VVMGGDGVVRGVRDICDLRDICDICVTRDYGCIGIRVTLDVVTGALHLCNTGLLTW
jgi:hypothetical protein